VLFYYTAVSQTYVDKISKNPDVKVEVVAFKWNWQFRYLDAKGADGQALSTSGASDYIPVLVVPTHKSILFYETSKDVIHSFWVPELLFKRDVFPGNVQNKFQVTVDKEGSYVGRCAELCGDYHSMMNFEVRAETPEDYDGFIAARKRGLSTPEALKSIGQPALATTTHPFDTDPLKRSAS
jgi:cytochrome c oxidase subunit 2